MFSKNKTMKSKRKSKIHLVFDEAKRRDFLTGFHKRKMERKRKAKEKFEKEFKEEKKRLKAEARQSFKNLVQSYTPVPEVEHLITKEYDEDDVNVKIVELSTTSSDHIGTNAPHYESDEVEEKTDNDNESDDELPGMEFDCKPSKTEKEPDKKDDTVKSKIEIRKILKKQATKNVQKSKMFQKKNKIERHKQKRQSLEQKKLRSKHQKMGKHKKNKHS
ncbi:hypothetical protein RN001_013792 [Aquatica leii]|uniref:Nucleolar protein 12 n=1 Tax=Aquatica leii TaxID=1421715 RepID=A0AAN7PS73_9COLE|nr:hypothetical protein RN001_013792 [Aquatica leii]